MVTSLRWGRGDACRMIKRCNDFGAGGVSVAIGELADGLDINLDAPAAVVTSLRWGSFPGMVSATGTVGSAAPVTRMAW